MNRDSIDPVLAFVRKTQITSIITAVAAGLVLKYFWSSSIGMGFVAGACVSIVNFQLMAVDALRITLKEPAVARKFIIGRFIIRYALLFVFLSVIATKTSLNVFAAFSGLFVVQMVLVCSRFYQMAELVLKTSRG